MGVAIRSNCGRVPGSMMVKWALQALETDVLEGTVQAMHCTICVHLMLDRIEKRPQSFHTDCAKSWIREGLQQTCLLRKQSSHLQHVVDAVMIEWRLGEHDTC